MTDRSGKQCLWILLIVSLVLTVLVATGTTLAPMSFDNLAQRATAIAHLRCVSVQSGWLDGEIWTTSQFVVLEEIKPDVYGGAEVAIAPAGPAYSNVPQNAQSSAPRISVRQLGGNIGGVRSHVDEVPEFQPGEELYLFLWRRPNEPYRVLGWTQGTFRVTRDARTGAAHVTQDSAIAAFHANTRDFQHSGVQNLPLAAFQEKLRQSLAATQSSQLSD